MFNIKCSKCKSKISRNFDFCPYCGFNIKKNKEGLLDEVSDMENVFSNPSFNIGNLNSIIGEIRKEMLNAEKSTKKPVIKEGGGIPQRFASGFNITISTKNGGRPMIDIKQIGQPMKDNQKRVQEKQEIFQNISEEDSEKISKLPRVEPKSKVRRMSNSVIYEIDLPGVNSIKDVFINKLNNSIEIRAMGKNKQYGKIIPISLPIKKYYLSDGKLVLELKS